MVTFRLGVGRTFWDQLSLKTVFKTTTRGLIVMHAASDFPNNDPQVPLVIDLDGTLISSDLLVETSFHHLAENPLRLSGLLSALSNGKAALKERIAKDTTIDVSHLPYNPKFWR
jgi:hypothetical protein